MKNKSAFSIIEIFIVIGIVALILFVMGCASPGAATFKAQKVSHATVEVAMSVWNDYVGQYHPGVETELKVKAAFEKYQAAQLLVSDALEIYYATTDETSTVKLEAASAAAAEALADLNALLKQFKIQVYDPTR